jgi:UDP-N-acetyl-2-amino-2-deoxyglucuronate dehydrogenase
MHMTDTHTQQQTAQQAVPNMTIGFGVIGAGLVAPFHLNAIKDSRGGSTIGVFDIFRENAAKVAEKFGTRVYSSLREMLEDKNVHVVCVATPNHLHRDAVIQSAEAGKHVLTEKPPAMSLRETDEMIDVCRKANVHFGCFVQCRVRMAVQAMKSAVDSGRFGRLLRADAYMKWFRPQEYYTSAGWRGQKKCGSGVTVAQGFHYIDLLQYLVGQASSVDARMTNIGHPGINLEDDVVAHIDFRCGAKGVVQLSTALWPGTDIRIEINGTDGTAVLIGEKIQTWKFRDERPEDEQIRTIGNSSQATGAGGAADFGHRDHLVVVQDMIDCITSGRDIVIPVTSVRPTLEMVLAMYNSAKHNGPVTLPIADDEGVWNS